MSLGTGTVTTINGVIDLLQSTIVNSRDNWSDDQKQRVNTFIDNAQKVFVALTDDIPNDDQFLELVDDLNDAFAASDFLSAGE